MAIKKEKNHFTLIELLIVVGIIAVLSSVVVAGTSAARAQARDNQRKADLATYQSALQLYFNAHKSYPLNSQDCNVPGNCLANQVLASLKNEGYLDSLPVDPRNTDQFQYRYSNNSATNGNEYKLYVALEKDVEAMINDGGTEDTAYEVFSTLGMHLAVNFPLIVGIGGSGGTTLGLNCDVKTIGTCNTEGGVKLMNLSDIKNAHAELVTGTNYNNNNDYCICCTGQSIINISNDCNASNKEVFLALSDTTNAHVGKESSPEFFDDFESGSLYGWEEVDTWNNGVVSSVSSEKKHNGQYSVKLYCNNGIGYIKKPFTTTASKVEMTFWFWSSNSGYGYTDQGGGLYTSNGTPLAVVGGSDNDMRNTLGQVFYPYHPAQQWINVRLIYDTVTNKADHYLYDSSGNLLASSTGITTNDGDIAYVRLNGRGYSVAHTLYYDDIIIQNYNSSELYYPEKACISTTSGGVNISCSYRNRNCQSNETTLCSISDMTNAHVGPTSGADAYDTKVCCKLGQ